MKVRGAIYYYDDIQEAYDKMNHIIEYYYRYVKPIEAIGGKYIPKSVRFENGDVWYLIKPNESDRGRAFDIALIDHRWKDDPTLHTIILPTIKAGPIRAYRFY